MRCSLKASEGERIEISETCASKAGCTKGVEGVKTNAPVAFAEDRTITDFRKQLNPKLEIYQDKAGEYRFRLRTRNGQPILASEGYTKKASCLSSIESVRKKRRVGRRGQGVEYIVNKEPRNQKVLAVAWAAQLAGESYGRYAAALSEEEKEEIYVKFAERMEEQRRAELIRLAGACRDTAS